MESIHILCLYNSSPTEILNLRFKYSLTCNSAYKDFSTSYYFIQGNLISAYNQNTLKTISFLIDTGSQITSISFNDAMLLGIDLNKLQSSTRVNIINTSMPSLILPGSGLAFVLPNKISMIIEPFNQIYVHNPMIMTSQDYDRIAWIPSTLGLDFLSRYRLTLQDTYCILEK
jgi:hypothetical protein